MRLLGVDVPSYTEFIQTWASSSSGNGVLRFLLASSEPSLGNWNSGAGWAEEWPQWKNRLVVFAFDWLGRQLAFDLQRRLGHEPQVSMLEPGTGEVLEIPHTFATLMRREIIEDPDAVLAVKFFREWRRSGGAAPTFSQCVGYKTPLFLGGKDTVDNLEITDLDVYVTLCGQLFRASHARG